MDGASFYTAGEEAIEASTTAGGEQTSSEGAGAAVWQSNPIARAARDTSSTTDGETAAGGMSALGVRHRSVDVERG